MDNPLSILDNLATPFSVLPLSTITSTRALCRTPYFSGASIYFPTFSKHYLINKLGPHLFALYEDLNHSYSDLNLIVVSPSLSRS